MEGFISGRRSATLMYGSIWHMMCEDFLHNIKTLGEDTFIDPSYFHSWLNNNLNKWCDKEFKDVDDYTMQELDGIYEDIKQRLCNAAEGWRRHVYKNILPHYEIIDVELEVYSPILKADGKPFRPRQHVIGYTMQDGSTLYRPPITYEKHALRIDEIEYNGQKSIDTFISLVYWKWFKVGKIDALLRKKGTKQLFVMDHKTTGTVGAYESRMSLDTQLEGYAYLLRYVLDTDERYAEYKDHIICGLLWDVCHSKVPKIPKPLMSGKLSIAKKSCPSWQYEKAIKELKENREVDEEEESVYNNHVEFCRENYDRKYFVLVENYISASNFDRIRSENLNAAESISSKRKKLFSLDYRDRDGFNKIASRYPLCSRTGNCSFASMCVANNTPCVIFNKQAPKLIWVSKPTN